MLGLSIKVIQVGGPSYRTNLFFLLAQIYISLAPFGWPANATVFLRNHNGSILHFVRFSNSSYSLLKSFPRTTEEETNPGAFWRTRTIIPVSPIDSLRVYVHPWSGTVPFLFLATLPCSRHPNSRKCICTPGFTRNEFSRPGTIPTPRSTLSRISIQYLSRRVEVLRARYPSERSTPRSKKIDRCLSSNGFDRKCYAYAQDYPSSRELRGDYSI